MNIHFSRILHTFTRKALPDLPFAREESHRFMPWIIAVMIAITALMLASAISIHSMMQRQLSTGETLAYAEISPQIARNKNVTRDIVSYAEIEPTLERAVVLSKQDIQILLQPWFGEDMPLDTLPLPQLIELEGKMANIDWAKIRSDLRAIHPEIRLDASQPWQNAIEKTAGTVKRLLVIFALIVLTAATGVVVMAISTSLRLHNTTIRILHDMGAEDTYIIRQFQEYGGQLALKGAIIGSGFAALIYLLFAAITSSVQTSLLPSVSINGLHIAMFCALPLIVALLTSFAASQATQARLQAWY